MKKENAKEKEKEKESIQENKFSIKQLKKHAVSLGLKRTEIAAVTSGLDEEITFTLKEIKDKVDAWKKREVK